MICLYGLGGSRLSEGFVFCGYQRLHRDDKVCSMCPHVCVLFSLARPVFPIQTAQYPLIEEYGLHHKGPHIMI